ncbi:MAG: putative CoA-binding protein [Patiriisocius sp.]|jgi:predicted CoA-binding protein
MQEKKKTVIVGSSERPGRYAYLAAQLLDEKGYEFIPLGISEGEVFGREILNIIEKPALEDVHTITMYISWPRQEDYMEYLLSLKPKRIIFNPGTENPKFEVAALKEGIFVEEACTLVLLRTEQY